MLKEIAETSLVRGCQRTPTDSMDCQRLFAHETLLAAGRRLSRRYDSACCLRTLPIRSVRELGGIGIDGARTCKRTGSQSCLLIRLANRMEQRLRIIAVHIISGWWRSRSGEKLCL